MQLHHRAAQYSTTTDVLLRESLHQVLDSSELQQPRFGARLAAGFLLSFLAHKVVCWLLCVRLWLMSTVLQPYCSKLSRVALHDFGLLPTSVYHQPTRYLGTFNAESCWVTRGVIPPATVTCDAQ